MEPHDKAQALMDKALSTTSEEEARTCALTAVKLMRKAGITVGGGGITRDEPQAAAPSLVLVRYQAMQIQLQSANARVVDLERRLELLMAARKPAPASAKSTKPGQPPAWNSGKSGPFSRGTSKSRSKAAPGRAHPAPAASLTPRWITTKFDNRCSRCDRGVWAGDSVWWLGPRMGAICQSCRETEKAAE